VNDSERLHVVRPARGGGDGGDGGDRQPPEDGLWGIEEAMRYLGVGRSWLYSHLHVVPHTRLPDCRKVAFEPGALRAWVKSRTTPGGK